MSKDYLKFIQNNRNLIDCCTSGNLDESIKYCVPSLGKKKSFDLLSHYPELDYKDLIKALEIKFGTNQILLGNGSDDLISKINLFINTDKTSSTLILTPTFYRIYKTLDRYELKNILKIKEIHFNEYSYVWLINPNPINNRILKKEKIVTWLKANPQTIFIVDEASILFLRNYREISLFSLTKKYINLIVLTSFSKFYGLPGLRFGFVSGNNQLMNSIKKTNPVFPINNVTKTVILNILNSKTVDETIRKNIEINKYLIRTNLKRIKGLEIKESKLNFMFIKHLTKNIYQRLLQIGVVTYNLDLPKDWTRITIHGSNSLNQKLLEKLNYLF